MRVALFHDWITGIGGDVRVLKALHRIYPEAPIYCLLRDRAFTDDLFPGAKIIPVTTLRFARFTKFLLPVMPSLIESIDLSDYDLVISTGSIFSKGIILRPRTIHINYCHSPTRQVWDLSRAYRRKIFQHILRIWDRNASTRVDHFVANSQHVRARIQKYYHRDSHVIYPPIEGQGLAEKSRWGRAADVPVGGATDFSGKSLPQGFFLIVSRLHKHKNIDIAIRAFNKLGWELVIIGSGPEKRALERMAHPNVHILGNLPDDVVAGYFGRCRAFILPQEEDFGIAPVEAMTYGKPVLALRAGGALEYVQEGVNGLFFDSAHEAVLADGVRRIRELSFDSKAIQDSVRQFSWQNFQSSFSNIINQVTRSRA